MVWRDQMQKAHVSVEFFEAWKFTSSKEPFEMNKNVFVRNGVKGRVSMDKIYPVSKKEKINMIRITSGDARSNNDTSRYIDKAAWEKLMDNDELASHFSV